MLTIKDIINIYNIKDTLSTFDTENSPILYVTYDINILINIPIAKLETDSIFKTVFNRIFSNFPTDFRMPVPVRLRRIHFPSAEITPVLTFVAVNLGFDFTMSSENNIYGSLYRDASEANAKCKQLFNVPNRYGQYLHDLTEASKDLIDCLEYSKQFVRC